MRNRRIGIAAKQFFLLFVTTMLLLFLLTWVNLQASRSILDRQSIAEAGGITEKTNQYLDLYVETIRSLLLYLQTEPEYDEERLRDFADMAPLVVETLYLLRDDGSVLSSRQVVFSLLGNDFSRLGFPLEEVGPALTWSEPYESDLSGLTVAFLQRIRQGVVIAEIDMEILRERMSGLSSRRDMALLITSPEGELILDDRRSPFSYSLARDLSFFEALAETRYGHSEVTLDGRTSLVFKSRQNALGWIVYAVVDSAFFAAELAVLYRNFRNIGVLLLAVLIASSLVLSLIITRPVRKLAGAMDRVQSLNQLTPISNTYTDELGELVDSYNNMMSRINTLTYENKEYEWRMLQSQIGPHFLYNTLACVSALAKRNRTDRIREAVDSLVRLLHYSFDRQSSEVSLQDEIDMVESYILIQNMRYGDRFSLIVDAPEDTRLLRVPALLLQPIVENSVFHGLSAVEEGGTVTITVERSEHGLRIVVRDDGKGIPPQQLAEIRASLDKRTIPDSAATHSPDRLNAIGLHNIHRRLQVHYGEWYGLVISGEPREGVEVVLRIPAIETPSTEDDSVAQRS